MATTFSETTLTITAKGQITLRRDLLQHLGVRSGAKVVLHKLPNGRVELEAAHPGGDIEAAFGLLRREDQRALSVDEMNELIATRWASER